MDDEDLADAAEAQKLETQASFAGLGSTQEDGLRRGLLIDLFKTSGDTVGIKLLQRMGWRQGEGVGPKVRRKARLGDGDPAADQGTHLFAPVNSPVVAINRKKDRFGLGYAAEERLSRPSTMGQAQEQEEEEDDGAFTLNRSRKEKIKPKKGAFGVGILNDTGSDDEDPYEMGPKISYNRIIGGDRKKKKGGLIANTASPAAKNAPTFMSRKLAKVISSTGFRKCHDGRLPLDGFVLTNSPLLTDQENKYPPPVIPEGWVPAKTRDDNNPDFKPSTFKSTADAARESTMDPAARAAVLGEQRLPGKSIFDYMSASARDRLVAASGNSSLPQARNEAAPAGFERSEAQKQRSLWDLVPKLDATTAASALQRGISGWMPYSEDEAKRARYRAFLAVSAGTRDSLPDRKPGSSTDEWVNEMNEFAQAALVFRPISGLMASRFTSGSSAPKLASDHDTAATSAKPSKVEDPAEQAAKIGMFGPMTRSRLPFYPTRLLCKRFGVKPPANADPGAEPATGEHAGSADGGGSAKSELVSKISLDQMMMEASRQRQTQPVNGGPREGALGGGSDEVAVSLKAETVDPETNAALEGQRAGEEVFKSIFGDDSDED